MGNLFVKKPKITAVDRAILNLKSNKGKIAALQHRLQETIAAENEAVLLLISEKQKKKALMELKKKKIHEKLLTHTDTLLLNIEQQLADMELAGKQNLVFESLKAAAKAITELQKVINPDDVQKLMDDNAEAKAFRDEINTIMGDTLFEVDDKAIEDEVDGLFQDEILSGTKQRLPRPPTSVPEPVVPEPVVLADSDEVLDLPDVPANLPPAAARPGQAAHAFSDAGTTTARSKVSDEPLPA